MTYQINANEQDQWQSLTTDWDTYAISFHDVLALSNKWLSPQIKSATLPDDIFFKSPADCFQFFSGHLVNQIYQLNSFLELEAPSLNKVISSDFANLGNYEYDLKIRWVDSSNFPNLRGRSWIRSDVSGLNVDSLLNFNTLYVQTSKGTHALSYDSPLRFDWFDSFEYFLKRLAQAGKRWIECKLRWVVLICSRAVSTYHNLSLSIEFIFHSRLIQPRVFNTHT